MNGQAKKIFGLYGAGGCGRGVMPLLNKAYPDFELFFVETKPQKNEVNGYPLISEEDFFKLECEERFFNVAIADSKARERISQGCLEKGAQPLACQASNVIIYDNNQIGEGAILCAYSMVTSNVKIGKFFHSNIYSYVEHDCIIGDYVTFAPRVSCNGNVHIRDHAYIGAGAIIKQGSFDRPLVIGEGAVIGMGAVVTKDVPAYTTVIGNPARVLVKAD